MESIPDIVVVAFITTVGTIAVEILRRITGDTSITTTKRLEDEVEYYRRLYRRCRDELEGR